jgi:hypothetical protein
MCPNPNPKPQAFSLIIPTKKWLLDRNLIKQGFLKGFSGNTQGTGWGQAIG